ncbi:hypothetical protein [Rhodopseudomonas palustris]|uniref:Glycosyltransferase RgtA/B/C/D-like domain-containing protein n=1 Tax=Rhodopseudomonas palustris (strain BisB18) TaxID=316056 RepID=Q20YV4_RHOPB
MPHPEDLQHRTGRWGERSTLLIVILGCLLLLLFGFSRETFFRNFVDADKLLAAEWTRHVFHDGLGWMQFQLPRTPSLFPDLLLFAPVQIATGSWRVATFVLAGTLLITLVVIAGLIVGRIATLPKAPAIAVCWIVSATMLSAELAFSGAGRHFQALQPVAHGGAFIASLAAAWLTDQLRRNFRPSGAIVLFAICALGVASDKLFVLCYSAPVAVALLLSPTASRNRRWLLSGVALASAAGLIGDGFLNRQPDIPLNWSMIPHHIGLFFSEINASLLVGTLIPMLLLLAAPLAVRWLPAGRQNRDGARFYWTIAACAMVGTLSLTAAFLYEDRGAYRYLASVIWWPTIFAAAAVGLLLKRWTSLIVGLTSVVAAGFAAIALYAVLRPSISLWTWQHPAVDCLGDDAQTAPLREGLAGYWTARQITASSEWRLHADPVSATGERYHWGNDPRSYSESRIDRGRPPDYRWILPDGLDQAALTARFGQPARVIDCAGQTIWIYSQRLTVGPAR